MLVVIVLDVNVEVASDVDWAGIASTRLQVNG